MKKLLILSLSFLMMISFAGCSSKSEATTADVTYTPSANAGNSKSEEEKQLEADMKELETIGDIEVSNGILTVSITIPADLAEGATQEELDTEAGNKYVSAKLNNDGSITYKFTKTQYKAMMQEITTSFEESFKEMINDTNYTFASIEHNSDFTEFDVKLDAEQVGLAESFTALVFFMYGGLYGIFSGKTPDNIAVNYYSSSGNLLNTANSSQMGK